MNRWWQTAEYRQAGNEADEIHLIVGTAVDRDDLFA
jgi:hypothetical protein